MNEGLFTIPRPTAPTAQDLDNPTMEEQIDMKIFDKEIDAYIKRKGILADNMQKAYSLILGQYTDLLQSKLKQQATWTTVSTSQDVIELLKLVKSIAFWFEDQKFLLLALYRSKLQLYNFH